LARPQLVMTPAIRPMQHRFAIKCKPSLLRASITRLSFQIPIFHHPTTQKRQHENPQARRVHQHRTPWQQLMMRIHGPTPGEVEKERHHSYDELGIAETSQKKPCAVALLKMPKTGHGIPGEAISQHSGTRIITGVASCLG
jgi:hypothetical protein